MTETIQKRGQVIISDCTLREGEQQPGVVLSVDEKVAIAEALAELGVVRAEIGTPAVSSAEREAITAVVDGGKIPETLAVCRARREDIEMAAECGVWGVVISSPVSRYQLESKFDWPLDKMVRSATEAHTAAKEFGLVTFASAYDTFRSTREDVGSIYGELHRQGLLDGVRVVDTVGVATPSTVKSLVQWCVGEFGLPVEVHFHDDFGLATANALAAVAAGADCVSCSVAGVGERAGNTALEQIVAALELCFDTTTGLQLEKLAPIATEIASVLGLQVQANSPIIGVNAFRHVSGISVSGFLRDPLAAQPVQAEILGRESSVVFGKTSGVKSVSHALELIGVEMSQSEITDLTNTVKLSSERWGRVLSLADVQRLVRQSVAKLAQQDHQKNDAEEKS